MPPCSGRNSDRCGQRCITASAQRNQIQVPSAPLPRFHSFSTDRLTACSMWGKDDATMAGTMRHMWSKGGIKPFFAAYRVTAVREGALTPTTRRPSGAACIVLLRRAHAPDPLAAAFGSIYESSRMFFRSRFRSRQRFPLMLLAFRNYFRRKQLRTDGAVALSSSPIVMVHPTIMPLHFSREFMCDCSAAYLAAIACGPHPTSLQLLLTPTPPHSNSSHSNPFSRQLL
jgi:hypothetical protein